MTLRKGDRTKQRIIENAVVTIATRGFEGVVLSEIAEAADVTRASIIQYFGSKEKLIEETIQHLGQTGRTSVLEFLVSNFDIEDPVERYIRANFAWARRHRPAAILLVYLITRAGYDRDAKTHVENIFDTARDSLAESIARAQKSRGYVFKNSKRAALAVHSLLLGFFVQIPFSSADEVVRYEEQCIDSALRIVGRNIDRRK